MKWGGSEDQTVSGVRGEHKQRVAAAVCLSLQFSWVKSGTVADENCRVTFRPALALTSIRDFIVIYFFYHPENNGTTLRERVVREGRKIVANQGRWRERWEDLAFFL